MGVKQRKWNDNDRRAFTDQRLRAQAIPGRRCSGPDADEWEDEPSYGTSDRDVAFA